MNFIKEILKEANAMHWCMAAMLLLSLAGAHNAVMCIGLFYIMHRISK